MLVGLSLVLVLVVLGTVWSCNQGPCGAASTSIVPLGIWICPFQAMTFHPCSALTPWRPFLRGENQGTELRLLWGAQHDPISPSRISWSFHFLQCEQCQARAGGFFGWILQIPAALNSSFDISTKEQFRCSFLFSLSSSVCISYPHFRSLCSGWIFQ